MLGLRSILIVYHCSILFMEIMDHYGSLLLRRRHASTRTVRTLVRIIGLGSAPEAKPASVSTGLLVQSAQRVLSRIIGFTKSEEGAAL